MNHIMICLFCGDNYIAKRSHSKTCSDTCRHKLWKQKQEENKVQPVMHREEFTPPPSSPKGGAGWRQGSGHPDPTLFDEDKYEPKPIRGWGHEGGETKQHLNPKDYILENKTLYDNGPTDILSKRPKYTIHTDQNGVALELQSAIQEKTEYLSYPELIDKFKTDKVSIEGFDDYGVDYLESVVDACILAYEVREDELRLSKERAVDETKKHLEHIAKTQRNKRAKIRNKLTDRAKASIAIRVREQTPEPVIEELVIPEPIITEKGGHVPVKKKRKKSKLWTCKLKDFKCNNCGETFKASKSQTKWCSRRCRYLNSKKKK